VKIVTYLGVQPIATVFSVVFISLFSFYTPLHVSALMGHLHAGYTLSLMDAITLTTDPFLGYALYIYTHIYIYILVYINIIRN
jgi:hypothetical protein